MVNVSVLSALGVGFALGLRHALDADHLAAVAVMVGERRRSPLGSSLVGLLWGAGHAAALSIVGLAVVVIGVRIPDRLASWMEAAVGVVLVALGGRLLLRHRAGAVLHAHPHAHGPREHFHPHIHEAGLDLSHDSHHALPPSARAVVEAGPGRRPFLIGILHGMAGSAALMLFVLTSIQGVPARLAYVALFAAGSVLGMAAMSVLVGLPFLIGGPIDGRAQRSLRLAAGSISLALGVIMLAGTAAVQGA